MAAADRRTVSLSTVLCLCCCLVTLSLAAYFLVLASRKVDEQLQKVDEALQATVDFMKEGVLTFQTVTSAGHNLSKAGQGIERSMQALVEASEKSGGDVARLLTAATDPAAAPPDAAPQPAASGAAAGPGGEVMATTGQAAARLQVGDPVRASTGRLLSSFLG